MMHFPGARTDILLADELNVLMKATQTDLEALRPKITDQNKYDQLMAICKEATQRNMNVAMLKERIEMLGTTVVKVAKEASTFLKFL